MEKTAILEQTAQMAASYFKNNTVPISEVPNVIQMLAATLIAQSAPGLSIQPPPAPQEPAVPVRKSITPDYLICLEDGQRLKSLKRYLRKFNLTPDQYRAKWGLPADYPMVAPNYSAKRSELAKQFGLGRKSGGDATEAESQPQVASAPQEAPKDDFQDDTDTPSTASAPVEPTAFEGKLPEGYSSVEDTFSAEDGDRRLICLLDGKSVRDLGRHARKHHNVSAEQYRTMFGLPADYPMAADRIEAYLAKAQTSQD